MDISTSVDNMLDVQVEGKKQRTLSPAGQNERYLYPMYSSWNAAYNLLSTGMVTVIWPAQISAILQDPGKDDLYNGFIPSPGALVSVLMSPVAGVASDYIQTKYGRRRVFIVFGSILTAITTIAMGPFNKNTGTKSVWAIMALCCAYQFGLQIAAVPYLALLPDVVRPEKIGLASGWHAAASALGSILGTLPAGFLVDASNDTNFWPSYTYVTVGFILLSLPTILYVKEIPLPRTAGHPCKNIKKTYFNLPLKQYKNFYWTILTRTFFNMGVYSILPYLQYFFRDIIKSENPATMSSIVLGVLILTSIPSTMVSGHLSDSYGRKAMVWAGAGIMAFVAYYPNLIMMFFLGFFLGIGYGMYQAVDGALALDVLPPGASIARDFGFWQMALVVPNAVAPAITGGILNAVRQNHSDAAGYCAMSVSVAAWFLLSFVCIFPVDTIFIPAKQRKLQNTSSSSFSFSKEKNNNDFQDLNSSTLPELSSSASLSNSSSSVSNLTSTANNSNVELPRFEEEPS